jgi:hypothetical protein
MTPLLVLPRLSDASDAAAWRGALDSDGWDGAWDASDLPRHDYFDRADLVMVALQTLREVAWAEAPLVLAVGSQFVVAELLALAGRACGIVLVDAPEVLDVGPDEEQRLQYEWLRRYADDRGRHQDLAPFCDVAFAARQREAITVPILELRAGARSEILATVRAWWGDVVAAQR